MHHLAESFAVGLKIFGSGFAFIARIRMDPECPANGEGKMVI
jgi:hypothetical protein